MSSSLPADQVPLIDDLVQTSFTVTAVLSRIAAGHDLSLTQLRVLAILRDREPKLAELADYLGLERSTVSGLIDRAVKRGLVRRVTGRDDGRVVRVCFTSEGRDLAEAIADEVSDALAPLTGALNATERNRLHVLLSKANQRSGGAP